MNRYGNKYGFHSPKTTEKTFLKVNEQTPYEFYDSSYKNDIVDSLEYEKKEADTYIKIYIPNSTVEDENKELFNKYLIIDEIYEPIFESKSLNEVISFLNSKEGQKLFTSLTPL